MFPAYRYFVGRHPAKYRRGAALRNCDRGFGDGSVPVIECTGSVIAKPGINRFSSCQVKICLDGLANGEKLLLRTEVSHQRHISSKAEASLRQAGHGKKNEQAKENSFQTVTVMNCNIKIKSRSVERLFI